MSSPPTTMPDSNKWELPPYMTVMAVLSASIGGIVAVLGDLRDALGFTDTEIGVIVTAGFLAAFVAQISLARLADRGHGRVMAITGIAISAVALFGMVFVDSVFGWVTCRALLGFAGGLALPGLRRAATVLDPDNVGENVGRLVVGEISGFLLGPIVAALFVVAFGIRAPFLAFAIGMVIFLPFVMRLPVDRGAIDTSRRSAFGLLKIRRLQGALLVVGGYFMMIGAWESVMPVMFKDRGGGALQTGIAFTLLGLPVVFLSPYAGKLADRLGPPKVAIIGTGLVSLSTMLYGYIPGLVWPVVLMVIFGISDAFGFTAAQVAVSRAVVEERQAAALGLMGAVEVLGAALLALPAALVYDSHGAGPAWLLAGFSSFAFIFLGAVRFRGTEPASKMPAPH
ncbi:MAG: MFS transporter [Actinobacteria bacterium]|nr:MFS transporter [Actinomycetota bacterium]